VSTSSSPTSGPTSPQTVPVDYTSRDYQSILNDLLAAIPTYMPEWTSTSPSDFGVALLELFSYQADIENYYIDRIGNEAFLPTAQQMSSVLNLAYLLDYQPAGPEPSSTTMSITLAAGTPEFVLPLGTQFSTAGTATSPPIVFETQQALTIPANTSGSPLTVSADVSGNPITVVQGLTVSNESLGTSDGTASQSYALVNTGVIEDSVQVMVDEGLGAQPWNQVTHLIDAGPTDPDYMLAIDATGTVYVTFGDANNGMIPSPQAIITATYSIGGGSATNVGANQITVALVASTVAPYILSVTNPSAAAGGTDAETIDQIRINAPQSLTAVQRCVSVQDYAAVALKSGVVSKAQAISSTPASVTLYVHPGGGPYAASDLTGLVNSISTSLTNSDYTGYLDGTEMAGTSVTVLGPLNAVDTSLPYVQVAMALSLQVKPQYQQQAVSQSVMAAIYGVLDFGSVSFGQRVTLSSMYAAAYSVPGVDYLIISTLYRADSASGLGDIVCGPSEIPVIISPDLSTSQISITASGGL